MLSSFANIFEILLPRKSKETPKITSNGGGYLDPESVIRHSSAAGDTSVKVYFNGLWYAAPDPRNKSAVQGCESSYLVGGFISYKTYKVCADSLPKADW